MRMFPSKRSQRRKPLERRSSSLVKMEKGRKTTGLMMITLILASFKHSSIQMRR